MKKIFIVTGEESGDLHAASLISELNKIISPDELIIKGIGSKHLENAGAEIFFNSKYLGAIGLIEVINKLSLYLNLEKRLLAELQIFMPHILILVDFPGFNLRIAKNVKKLLPETKIVYYLPPQVWAWNQGRTKILAKYCDLVLCGLPFEEEFHRKRGVNAYYVGSPIVNEHLEFEKSKVRSELGISNGNTLIGLFPGSRKSEIHYMLPVLLEAVHLLHKIYPNYNFMLAQAQTISNLEKEIERHLQKSSYTNLSEKIKVLPPGNNYKLLAACDFAWLTSGTVTLEAALYETPMILGYRGNFINYLLYLILKRVNMIGLPNIIIGKKIVPELIQYDATPENYYQNTKEWLEVPGHIEKIKSDLKKVKEKLSNKNASREAALKIRELIPKYKVI